MLSSDYKKLGIKRSPDFTLFAIGYIVAFAISAFCVQIIAEHTKVASRAPVCFNRVVLPTEPTFAPIFVKVWVVKIPLTLIALLSL